MEQESMRNLMLALALLMLSSAACARPWKTSDKGHLTIARSQGGFQVTLTNVGSRPLAVVPLSDGWTHHWNVWVADRLGHEYGLVVPPGPAFMPEPGNFRVLMPEKSMSARYSFADFRRVNRQTDAIEALRAAAVIRVGYTFNAESGELDRVLTRSESPIPKSGDPSIAPEWTALFKKADFLSPLQSSLKL